MSALVVDLLNLTRTRLGSSIPIVLAPTNLREVCESVIEEISAAHPGKHLEVTYEGDLVGNWDSVKLGQVVSNLVGNAIEHGAQREPCGRRSWRDGRGSRDGACAPVCWVDKSASRVVLR